MPLLPGEQTELFTERAKKNIMLIGPTGVGKTYSLRTIIESGLELFVMSTEPGIEHLLGHIPCESGCHWHYVAPARPSWDAMLSNARLINSLGNDALQKMQGMNKHE